MPELKALGRAVHHVTERMAELTDPTSRVAHEILLTAASAVMCAAPYNAISPPEITHSLECSYIRSLVYQADVQG